MNSFYPRKDKRESNPTGCIAGARNSPGYLANRGNCSAITRHRMNPTPITPENPLKRVANIVLNPLQRVFFLFRRRFQSAARVVEQLQTADIKENLAQVLTLSEIRQAGPAALSTGPSRTGDIEMALAIGVHEPEQIHVFCVSG